MSETINDALMEAMAREALTRVLFSVLWDGDGHSALEAIAQGADVNGRDESGRTPLHCAVNARNNIEPRVIDRLLRKGADVHACTPSGNTPWHLFCKSVDMLTDKQLEIATLLLRAGARTDLKNNRGQTGMACLKNLDTYLRLTTLIQQVTGDRSPDTEHPAQTAILVTRQSKVGEMIARQSETEHQM